MAGRKRVSGRYSAVAVSICILGWMSSAAAPWSALSGAERVRAANPSSTHVISDGQFVYGPNIGDFVLRDYLRAEAPQLLTYSDQLYGRAEYYSINPKVYLTLLELHSHLITAPAAAAIDNPLGLNAGDFLSQIDIVSESMVNAYYLHLNSYSELPPGKRTLAPLRTRNGEMFQVAPEANAGTYAVAAALAALESKAAVEFDLDSAKPESFYQTYRRLFPDDPLSEQNHIYIPGDAAYQSAPPDLLQLPYTRGEAWLFNGVHNWSGGDATTGFTDASSIDFSPGWPAWGADTSNMWVVAASAGTPTKISDCSFRVSGSDGWETAYYHLENIQSYSGWINQNDRIGVIANTEAEALCNGGFSTGPHVHFALRRNGAYVAINGTALSGWFVHSGRWPYDSDPNYMWLERSAAKKYVGDWLTSEAVTSVGAGTYDDLDPAWTYGGGWGAFAVPGAYNGGLHIAVTKGSTATLYMNGTGFKLTYLNYPNLGRIGVYVDGNGTPVTTLDTNAPASLATYTSPELTPGIHVLQFKHDGPTGSVIAIDSLEVTAPTYYPVGTYDDSDAAWTFGGTWVAPAIPGAYSNTMHIAVAQGSTATFNFSGSGFVLTYLNYTGWGQIGVYVDGGVNPLITLNTNAPPGLPIYGASGLPSGNHTVTFKHDGPAGTYIAIDRLDITP